MANDSLMYLIKSLRKEINDEIKVPAGFAGTLHDYTQLIKNNKYWDYLLAPGETPKYNIDHRYLYEYTDKDFDNIFNILNDAFTGNFDPYKYITYIPIFAYIILAVYHPDLLLFSPISDSILNRINYFDYKRPQEIYEIIVTVLLVYHTNPKIINKIQNDYSLSCSLKEYHILMILYDNETTKREKNKFIKILHPKFFTDNVGIAIKENCYRHTLLIAKYRKHKYRYPKFRYV